MRIKTFVKDRINDVRMIIRDGDIQGINRGDENSGYEIWNRLEGVDKREEDDLLMGK